jgi:hypothetical protein
MFNVSQAETSDRIIIKRLRDGGPSGACGEVTVELKAEEAQCARR